MANDVIEKIMREYDQQFELYSDFTENTKDLIVKLLNEKNLNVHSITERVKERPNLLEKLTRPDKYYLNLNEVMDIAGIRIITFFSDEVYAVAEIIKDQFEIDDEHSVDKSVLIEPDRFGYISLHYIAKFKNHRLELPEYHHFSDCKVEIQMRSILQHAWAENEHDIGYKTKQSIPKNIRRSFSRIAGLLEIADSEFIRIKNSLKEYEESVTSLIIQAPNLVFIDKVSLNIFIKNSDFVHDLDTEISIATKIQIVKEETYFNLFIDNLIDRLEYVGLNNIDDINSSLNEFADIINEFAKVIVDITPLKAGIEDIEFRELPHGFCSFYLTYVLVARNESSKEVLEYLEKFDIGIEEGRYQDANSIISYYKQAIANSRT